MIIREIPRGVIKVRSRDGKVSEAVQFRGSSTDVHAIRLWQTTGNYVESLIKTRDYRTMEVDCWHPDERSGIAHPGDWIIRDDTDGKVSYYPCMGLLFWTFYERIDD